MQNKTKQFIGISEARAEQKGNGVSYFWLLKFEVSLINFNSFILMPLPIE